MFIPDSRRHGGALLGELGEQSLVERLRWGDRLALADVAEHYGPRLLRLAHRLLGWSGDAEDVVQEVLAKLLAKPDRIGKERGLEAWLVAVTINQCRSHRRMARTFERFRRRFPMLRHRTEQADAVQQDDLSATVRDGVQKLRPRDREVIVLHHLEQIPILEIAQMLGIKPNAVEVRLHRARERLKQQLKGLM